MAAKIVGRKGVAFKKAAPFFDVEGITIDGSRGYPVRMSGLGCT